MEKQKQYLFTSEVVSPGHPDKCADIIADSIVLLAKSIEQIFLFKSFPKWNFSKESETKV